MKMNEIRDRLHVLAVEHDIPELHELAEATKRRFFGRVSTQSQRVSPAKKQAIVNCYKRNPDFPFQKIATLFGVNTGRVSEIINGMRE